MAVPSAHGQMNVKLIIAFVIYLAIFISGLIISIAMGVTKSNFDGNCMLYLDLDWKDHNFIITTESFGASSTCDFVIYLPVVDCVLYPFIMLLLIGYVVFQSFKGNNDAEKLIVHLPLLMLNTLSFVLTFIAACILSTGRSKMCSSLLEKSEGTVTCYVAEKLDWGKLKFDGSSFVRDIVLAEVVAWVCLIWWLVLIIPEAIILWKSRGSLIASTQTAKT